MKQPTIFDGARHTIQDSIDKTVESMNTYGPLHDHWAFAWSGGKDSTTTLTVILYLLDAGLIQPPRSITVFYADTRLELTPLAIAAQRMMQQLRDKGITVRIVMAEMDERFMVYMLGRGVPPAGAGFRWCTGLVKIKPMQIAVRELAAELGSKFLMVVGLRIGESAARDDRIAISCGRNGGECGQGWYSTTLPESACNTLSPVLHWRVCHVWEWLNVFAPSKRYGRWDTELLAHAYGGDQAEEINARTGCVGCPVASRDMALDAILPMSQWSYLSPLRELRPLWNELRKPKHRHRKHGGETNKDGSLVRNQNRPGPLTLDARRMGLARVLEIQDRVNLGAERMDREHAELMLRVGKTPTMHTPRIDILNAEEVARIEELIDAKTFPNKWTGDEPNAGELYVSTFTDGSRQELLFGN